MKARILLPLLLCLLLSACAGGGEKVGAAAAPQTPELPDPADTIVPAEAESLAITYRVEVQKLRDEAAAEDGTPLAGCEYELPVMTPLLGDGTPLDGERAATAAEQQALAAAETFNAEFRTWAQSADFQELAALAADDYAWKQSEGWEWGEAYFQGLTSTIYQTERLVSVSGSFYYYGGGAHPSTVLLGWNFDLSSGAFLSPELLLDGEGQEAVTQELIRQAKATAASYHMAPEEFFWESYESILSDWASYAVTLDETDMTIAYSPYDIAPYATGPQIYVLSREWLAPYLSEYGRSLLGVES